MKKHLLTILLFIFGLPMLAQDIHFPSAIVAAGGSSQGGSVTLSYWRLAPVHVITVPQAVLFDIKQAEQLNWEVKLYPNPVKDILNLEFKLSEEREFILCITDVFGRVIFNQDARTFMDNTSIELNISDFSPALYLLQISSPDRNTVRAFRIQKL